MQKRKMAPDPGLQNFNTWVASLETRHLADLTFPEVSRALRALSSTYVERRGKIPEGAALAGAGKRAAFALFYGPLHFLIVRAIVESTPGATDPPPTLVDLGCGTGAASAAWASACAKPPAIIAIDRHKWALDEAATTFREFGLTARTRVGNIEAVDLPKGPAAFLAAFALNELADAPREALLDALLGRAASGDRVLVVEPLAGFVAPWWRKWAARVQAAGGRATEWRHAAALPAIVAKLDRAAGLRHDELTARSLYL
jgi:methyltransferase family protein